MANINMQKVTEVSDILRTWRKYLKLGGKVMFFFNVSMIKTFRGRTRFCNQGVRESANHYVKMISFS